MKSSSVFRVLLFVYAFFPVGAALSRYEWEERPVEGLSRANTPSLYAAALQFLILLLLLNDSRVFFPTFVNL